MRTTCGIELNLFWILVAGLMLTGLFSTAQGAERVIGQFETPKVKINYVILLPEDYGADPGRQWPLILVLHGSSPRGDNVYLLNPYISLPLTDSGSEDILEQFIRVWPQCPANTSWLSLLEVLDAFLDEVLAEYTVDADRLYLMGGSMGGTGAWALSMAYPERFAAVAPVAGSAYCIQEVCVLKDVPVWVFHGAKDTSVSPAGSERMVEALKACGGDVKFTLYPDAGHFDGAIRANTTELYDWFLQHSLQPVIDVQPGGKVIGVQPSGKRMTTWGQTKQH